jgi:hypothetical protein
MKSVQTQAFLLRSVPGIFDISSVTSKPFFIRLDRFSLNDEREETQRKRHYSANILNRQKSQKISRQSSQEKRFEHGTFRVPSNVTPGDTVTAGTLIHCIVGLGGWQYEGSNVTRFISIQSYTAPV